MATGAAPTTGVCNKTQALQSALVVKVTRQLEGHARVGQGANVPMPTLLEDRTPGWEVLALLPRPGVLEPRHLGLPLPDSSSSLQYREGWWVHQSPPRPHTQNNIAAYITSPFAACIHRACAPRHPKLAPTAGDATVCLWWRGTSKPKGPGGPEGTPATGGPEGGWRRVGGHWVGNPPPHWSCRLATPGLVLPHGSMSRKTTVPQLRPNVGASMAPSPCNACTSAPRTLVEANAEGLGGGWGLQGVPHTRHPRVGLPLGGQGTQILVLLGAPARPVPGTGCLTPSSAKISQETMAAMLREGDQQMRGDRYHSYSEEGVVGWTAQRTTPTSWSSSRAIRRSRRLP